MTTNNGTRIKVGDLVEVSDEKGRTAGFGEVLEIDTALMRTTIQIYSLTANGRLSRESRKTTVPLVRLRKTDRVRVGERPERRDVGQFTEAGLARMDDRQFVAALRGRPIPESWAELSTRSTGPEAEDAKILARLLRRSGLAHADFAQGSGGEPSDEEILHGLQEQRDGTHARRLAQRRTVEQQAERLGWSLRAHRSGEIIPSDDEEQLRELGML